MTNTGLLREKIELSGFRLTFIAQKLGITRYSLTLKISNKYEFKASEIKTLEALLGLSQKEKEEIFFA